MIDVLWTMADTIDGGIGGAVHHGCPDSAVATRHCHECHLTVDAEVGFDARESTVFAAVERT